MSCAIAVAYTDDWTDACNATNLDVAGHASAIFEGCEDGGNGKVVGKVPFIMPNCPADVQIIHTNKESPWR